MIKFRAESLPQSSVILSLLTPCLIMAIGDIAIVLNDTNPELSICSEVWIGVKLYTGLESFFLFLCTYINIVLRVSGVRKLV